MKKFLLILLGAIVAIPGFAIGARVDTSYSFLSMGTSVQPTSATEYNVGVGTSTPFAKLTVWGLGTTTKDTMNVANSASTTLMNIEDSGNVYFKGMFSIGSTTPSADFQVTTETANATTSVIFGKEGQNKGTCITEYNTAGTAVYRYIVGTTPTYTTTKPSGCKN